MPNREIVVVENLKMDMVHRYYTAVKGSLHASDSQVFGLTEDEISALSKRCALQQGVLNGIAVKCPAINVINYLSELGYRVLCCSGEAECTWTLVREF